MLTAEYDREMDIAVNRREAREEAQQYFLDLINQGLSLDDIKERLQQERGNKYADSRI
jgi:intein-encoded DNA endonuclease-like protein